LADTRPRLDVDQEELGHEAAHAGSELPPDEPPSPPRRRRPLFIVLGVVVGIVVYALAFQQTQVSLDEITSETRQQSLSRILRALAQPDLITYDTEPTITEIELGVPCGPTGLATSSPSPPPRTAAIRGTPSPSPAPASSPASSFRSCSCPTPTDITLRLAGVNAEPDGTFEAQITLPERTSDRAPGAAGRHARSRSAVVA
jgi:hypothetical protein